jgi:hypothetical protein
LPDKHVRGPIFPKRGGKRHKIPETGKVFHILRVDNRGFPQKSYSRTRWRVPRHLAAGRLRGGVMMFNELGFGFVK